MMVPFFFLHFFIFVHAFAPPSPAFPGPSASSTINHRRRKLCSLNNNNNGGGGEEEWRAFRARLVQNGLPSLLDNTASSSHVSDDDNDDPSKKTTPRYAHITTPLVEVGSVLVSIPTTDLCQALDQQYWHRSVVLITEVSENIVCGSVEDTVPEEQLAQGDRRGRWSYRGLLLNRPTNLVLGVDSENKHMTTTTVQQAINNVDDIDPEDFWRIQRGGDLLGLDSSSGTEVVCLHRLGTSDPSIREASTKLVGNLCYATLSDARELCNNNSAKYQDFFIFGGFCAWRPGQLEREMGKDRNEWLVISVDENSIWDELQRQRRQSNAIVVGNEELQHDHHEFVANGLLGAGTDMWRSFLDMIDVSESKATDCLPERQLNFYDQMLSVWACSSLNISYGDASSRDSTTLNDCSGQIGKGALVRAKSPPTNDMLLYDAEFIRSLILVLDDTHDATVGIILNHPMSAAIEVKDGEEPIIIRYGGPIDVASWRDGSYREHEKSTSGDDGESGEEEDEMYDGFLDFQNEGVAFDDLMFDNGINDDLDDDDDDSSFLWIHRDLAIGATNGGGTRVGTSNLWLINEDNALKALQSGALRLDDTMVFSGVCIWEKDPDVGACGGGLREQVDALQSLEIIRAYNDQTGGDLLEYDVWEILSKRQNILTKKSLDSNINAAIDAWGICSGACRSEGTASEHTLSRIRLSGAALKAWLGVNILEDPLGIFVEVGDDHHRRKLSGQ